MQIKGRCWDSMELQDSSFSEGPKRFDTIDMALSFCKFIGSMLYTIMLFITQIYQAIVTAPAIGMDNTFWGDTLPRIMACNVALAQLGTISVYTFPLR